MRVRVLDWSMLLVINRSETYRLNELNFHVYMLSQETSVGVFDDGLFFYIII
jgi:hypothetical protein